MPCEPRLAASKNVRIKYAQGETTDNTASDASTDHSMLDARDTAVTLRDAHAFLVLP